MKCAARVALGIAGGYFLGRTKKLKLALMLGGMAAGRRGGAGELLSQGSKLLKNSPELAKLTDELRGRLIEAGKGAAVAVAARQVESLADRVSSRVEGLGTARPKVPDIGPRGRDEDTEDLEDVEPADEAVQDDRAGEDSGEAAAPAEEPAREAPRRASKPSRGRAGTASRTRTPSSARGAAGRASATTKVPRPARARRGDGNG